SEGSECSADFTSFEVRGISSDALRKAADIWAARSALLFLEGWLDRKSDTRRTSKLLEECIVRVYRCAFRSAKSLFLLVFPGQVNRPSFSIPLPPKRDAS